MEFPDLGKNCTWPGCKALDFLPFTCSFCKFIFCKDHYNTNTHKCKEVPDGANESGEIKLFTCTYENCERIAPIQMLCSKCSNHFCLDHRFHSCFNASQKELDEKRVVWNAPREQFKESIKEVNKIVNKGIKKAEQNPKKQATALKVQLMRLKSKAKGSSTIPTTDRLYFLILLPKNAKSKACFISKDWSVGKVIDSLSNICDIVNKNNELKAPKLRIFKSSDGTQVSKDMGTLMNDLISNNVIANGESLILEYVNPDENLETFNLKNYEEYMETDF